MSAVPLFQTGHYNNVHLGEQGQVVKTSLAVFPTAEAADTFCGRLEAYHAALAAGPLAVADLLAVDILEADDGYRIRHEMAFVDGPHLDELSRAERRQAVGGVASALAEAPALPDEPDKLLVPVDAKGPNLKGVRPKLIDIFPPYQWGGDGLITVGLGAEPDTAARAELTQDFGTKAGALASVVRSAMPAIRKGEGAVAYLERQISSVPDWYVSLLPGRLPADLRRQVQEQVVRGLRLQQVIAGQVEQVAADLGIEPEERRDPHRW